MSHHLSEKSSNLSADLLEERFFSKRCEKSGLKLFLCIHIDHELKQALSHANQALVSLFLGGGDYLSPISYQDQSYLGKPVPPLASIIQLENLEVHLLSLLKKLAPHYLFSKNFPVLLIKR